MVSEMTVLASVEKDRLDATCAIPATPNKWNHQQRGPWSDKTQTIPFAASSYAPSAAMFGTTTLSYLPGPYFLSNSSWTHFALVASRAAPRTLYQAHGICWARSNPSADNFGPKTGLMFDHSAYIFGL